MRGETREEEYPIRGYHRENSPDRDDDRPLRLWHPAIIYISVLVILGITGLYLYFVPRYIITSYDLKIVEVGIRHVDYSLRITKTFRATGRWTVKLSIANPNKWSSIHYDGFKASLMYLGGPHRWVGFPWKTMVIRDDQPMQITIYPTVDMAVVEHDYNFIYASEIRNISMHLAEDMKLGALNFRFQLLADIVYKTWLVEQPRQVTSICYITLPFDSTTGTGTFDGAICDTFFTYDSSFTTKNLSSSVSLRDIHPTPKPRVFE